MSVSLTKVIQVLSKTFEKRSPHELNRVVTFLKDLLNLDDSDYLSFLAFYMILHTEQGSLSRYLQENSRVFLLDGSLRAQNKLDNSETKIEIGHHEPVIQCKNTKIYLELDSVAASISPVHYQNCQILSVDSSIHQQMQFLQSNNYFKKMGTITCLTLLSNCLVKKVIRGQTVGSMSSPMEYVYFIRKGQMEIHQISNVQMVEGVKDNMVCMTISGGEFFGYFIVKDTRNDYTIKCKSAFGTLFCFQKSFFNNYIQIICGDTLKSYQSSIIKYIQNQSLKTSQVRQKNLSLLTQTNFHRRKSTSQLKFQLFPSVQLPRQQRQKSNSSAQQVKSISSRQMKYKQPPFQQLTRLEFKKYKCAVYEKISQPLPYTRNQIFYDFFKNNWQATYAKRKSKTLKG